MQKEIEEIKEDIRKEESNKKPNQARLAVLYSNLSRRRNIQYNLNEKNYWAKM